jgi:hypothetical protein
LNFFKKDHDEIDSDRRSGLKIRENDERVAGVSKPRVAGHQ